MDWASLAQAPIHLHVVLITGAYADIYTHTHTLLDSQCLIFRVVTADDTQRTLKMNPREMVKVLEAGRIYGKITQTRTRETNIFSFSKEAL